MDESKRADPQRLEEMDRAWDDARGEGFAEMQDVAFEHFPGLLSLVRTQAAEIERLRAVVEAAEVLLRYPGLKEHVGTQVHDPLAAALARLEEQKP